MLAMHETVENSGGTGVIYIPLTVRVCACLSLMFEITMLLSNDQKYFDDASNYHVMCL